MSVQPSIVVSALPADVITPTSSSYIQHFHNKSDNNNLYGKRSDGSIFLIQNATGAGTVTSVSVDTINGFSGTVNNPNTTPVIEIETTVTGVLVGDGTGVSAADASDTFPGNAASASILNPGRTINGVLFDGSADIIIPSGAGTVTNVSVVSANGFSGSVSNPNTTPAITISSINLGFNVLEYGVVGDGITDDSAALNTLVNVTAPVDSTIYFPPNKTYLALTSITTAKRMCYVGLGNSVLKTTANIPIFTILSGAEKTKFSDLIFQGNSIAGTSQIGIYFNSGGSCVVDNCYFYNMAEAGIVATNIENDYELGLRIDNCKFYNNLFGVDLIFRGEYTQILNSDFIFNVNGIRILGGNCTVSNNNINYNTNGLEVTGAGGVNTGKIIIVGNHINHSTTTSVYIHNITVAPCTLQANHIIFGIIDISTTYGVMFQGGNINVPSYTFTNNLGLKFIDVRFSNSLSNTVNLIGTAPSYFNCTQDTGAFIYDNTIMGSIFSATDNNYDIGAIATGRFRTAYLSTSVISPSGIFSTSVTTPLVIGGSSTTQTLIFKTTTGVGTTGADHIFIVGNNGATEALRILNSGNLGVRTGTTAPTTITINRATGGNLNNSPAIEFDLDNIPMAYLGVAGSLSAGVTGSAIGDFVLRCGSRKIMFSTDSGLNPHLVVAAINGRVGVGTDTPTGLLQIKASPGTPNNGAIKLTNGTQLGTPEPLVLEPETGGANLLFTNQSGTRYTLAKVLTATAVLNFDLTAVNSQDLTMTVTGAASGDAVSIAIDPASMPADITYTPWVSSANTVSIRCARVGGGGAVDPASGTFRAVVTKFT